MSRKFEVISKYIREDGTTDIKIPERKTKYSAGYDISASQEVYIYPKQMQLVPTGIKADMEEGEYLDLRIRSGLSIKNQTILVNGAAVIDKDYYNNEDNEGHIMVPLYNLSLHPLNIRPGDRIAQGIFTKYFTVDGDEVDTVRTGGFGSTGVSTTEVPAVTQEEAVALVESYVESHVVLEDEMPKLEKAVVTTQPLTKVKPAVTSKKATPTKAGGKAVANKKST